MHHSGSFFLFKLHWPNYSYFCILWHKIESKFVTGVAVHLDMNTQNSFAPLSSELVDLYAVFWNMA